MAKELLSEELWAALEPLIPAPPPRPKGGRTRVPNRATLTGILFVLKSGMPWEFLPPEMGCGSEMTCWRRLREWQAKGVWHKLHPRLLDVLGEADLIDWSRAALDASMVPAPGGRSDRPESDGSRQIGHEAPSGGRPAGDFAGYHPLGG